MNLKPNQAPPIVPHVLVVGDRLHPYKLPPVERVEILYSTTTQVKLSGGKSKAQQLVYCIPDNDAWIEFLEWYELLQTALDKLADYLQSLGHYPDKLKTLGDNAPNPLTATVINAPSPDYNHSPIWVTWEVYPNKRIRQTVSKHTPEMLKLSGNNLQEYATQANHFCCPDSLAWHKFGNLQNTAVFQSKCLLKFLEKLGTYKNVLTNEKNKHGTVTNYESKLYDLPPENDINTVNSVHSAQIKIGGRVTFTQSWNDETHQFEGIVQTLNKPPGTAIIQYKIPEHLQDGIDRPNILQSPIALFSLANALPPEPVYSFGTDEFPQSPPEAIHKPPPESLTEQINSEISHIRSQGTVAPDGVWIERCKVKNSNFIQAYWRSRDPCFTPKKGINPEAKCKKQYIGKENSAAHKVAIAQIERRNKIQKLIKQLPKHLRESI